MSSKKRIYELVLKEDVEDSGVDAISLVKYPAIGVNWVALNKSKKQRVSLKITDKVKQIVTGPVLIPDQEIIRFDENGNEYWVKASKETIELASQKFLKSNYQHNTTLEHKVPLSNNTIIESWIIQDSNLDKAKALGFSLPEGTWMVSMKIDDKKFYEKEILTGKTLGFSLEGIFDHVPIQLSKEIKNNKMKKRITFSDIINVQYDLVDGGFIIFDETLFATGQDEAGNELNPFPDGSYETVDGIIFTIENGEYVPTTMEDVKDIVEDVVSTVIEDNDGFVEDATEEEIASATEDAVEDVLELGSKRKPKFKSKKNVKQNKTKKVVAKNKVLSKLFASASRSVQFATVYTNDGVSLEIDDETFTIDVFDSEGVQVGLLRFEPTAVVTEEDVDVVEQSVAMKKMENIINTLNVKLSNIEKTINQNKVTQTVSTKHIKPESKAVEFTQRQFKPVAKATSGGAAKAAMQEFLSK